MTGTHDKFPYMSRADVMTPANIAVWDHLSVGVCVVDGSGICVYMNRIQQQMDGFAAIGGAVGRHITELYRPNRVLRLPTVECLRTGEPIIRKAYAYRTTTNIIANSVEDFFPLFDQGRRDGVLTFCSWDTDTAAGETRQVSVPPPFLGETDTRYTFESIVGNDAALRAVVDEARASSRIPANVMIWGESGTGKELLAQSIHAASPRRNRPFVAVSCAAIPENLLEGLLFGTIRGAFTDAVNAPGLFEQADGGTLLLDELNSMPGSAQAKLLRVLQERRIRRVGSQREKPVDVRIVSVLSESPLLAVEKGLLRRDLYYRLAVVGISVPPLRERREDIPLLIASFLRSNAADVKVDDEVLQMFREYGWPGNVRELLQVIEGSLVLLGDRRVIDRHCLPRQFLEAWRDKGGEKEKSLRPSSGEGGVPGIYDYGNIRRGGMVPYKENLNAFEGRCIRNVLRVTGGNVARAARMMALTAPGLRYKMKTLGITEDEY